MTTIQNDLTCAIDQCSVLLDGVRFLPAPVVRGRVTDRPRRFEFKFHGSFQPMAQKELELLPEGFRDKGVAKLYTEHELFTDGDSECGLPDLVIYRGVTYQVERVDDWLELGGYYKVLLRRTDR